MSWADSGDGNHTLDSSPSLGPQGAGAASGTSCHAEWQSAQHSPAREVCDRGWPEVGREEKKKERDAGAFVGRSTMDGGLGSWGTKIPAGP